METPSSDCDTPGCCSGIERRDFIKLAGIGLAAAVMPGMRVMAGPFDAPDFEKLIPADKKLSPEWVRSLFARGEPAVYRGAELKHIGMPVGGVCAGQLYLCGDGRLGHWNIFNEDVFSGYSGRYNSIPPEMVLEQGFALHLGDRTIPLDATGFPDVTFCGQYPVGTVEYRSAAVPLAVTLEAFSPFIPLNTDDSSLPATMMRFTLRNVSSAPVEATLAGTLENGVGLHHRYLSGERRNRLVAEDGLSFIECSAKGSPASASGRADVTIEDWSKPTYEGWTVEGTAFGAGPAARSDFERTLGALGGEGDRAAIAQTPASGGEAGGRLASAPFTISRNYITVWLWNGGGNHPKKSAVNVIVGGKVVASASAARGGRMERLPLDVRACQGQQATLEILDHETTPSSHLVVGRIAMVDHVPVDGPFEALPDAGTMGLALLGARADSHSPDASAALDEKLAGSLGRLVKLAPGEATTVTFAITWFFPNLNHIPKVAKQGQYYASRFDSALAVARYIAANSERLAGDTLLWRQTWYDSSLPHWFLDRTFLNISILATTTCFRFKDRRFWGWEGVGCCTGTCGHVYYYAQAMGRLFPDIEREQREFVDFGLAQNPDGSIRFRGENNTIAATDGQAGYILRALREHQMSADGAFLHRIWPRVKMATAYLIGQDPGRTGLLEGAQQNTLDTAWYGKVAWLSGLYLASLQAAAAMADIVDDGAFAKTCRDILAEGQKRFVPELFNGNYFINRVDPKHLDAINSGTGCEIDQVMGQSWAFQVGLPRVLPERETRQALRSIWRFNFTPDVGPYRAKFKSGRWYALAGEAGTLICTFPQKDWTFEQAAGKGKPGFTGYFNECMAGYEHQVAGHMIWEGILMEGLAVERAIHDRYHAAKRNPWNEVECGDHYARSMASYGVFIAACGFEYDGPRGFIAFAPRLAPEKFRAAFTSAEGWGSYAQVVDGQRLDASIELKHGRLRLRAIALAGGEKFIATSAEATVNGRRLPTRFSSDNGRTSIALVDETTLSAGDKLEIVIRGPGFEKSSGERESAA